MTAKDWRQVLDEEHLRSANADCAVTKGPGSSLGAVSNVAWRNASWKMARKSCWASKVKRRCPCHHGCGLIRVCMARTQDNLKTIKIMLRYLDPEDPDLDM